MREEPATKRAVLITGGTSGIGAAAARLFHSQGCNVLVSGRDAKKKTMSTLEPAIRFAAGDVRKAADCQRIVAATIEKFGRLDVLVNAAGVYHEGGADDLAEDDYERVMDTNVKGTMFMTRFALPPLKKTKGCVINVSSDAGSHGNFFCSLYCATKGAVNMYTKAAALEAAHFGVRINAVAPGDVDTPLTRAQLAAYSETERAEKAKELANLYPLQRIAKAEEIAALIYYLASPDASFITGAIMPIDGGLTAR